MKEIKKNLQIPFYILLTISISGFLFGYVTTSISGSIVLIAKEFHLSVIEEGVLVAMVLIGAFFGALACGKLMERFGRKFTILVAAILFAIGLLWTADARSYAVLLMGRGVSGIAVGIASVAVPVYLGEISPPKARGRYVTMYILVLTVGILVAYLVNRWFVLNNLWRQSFAYGAIPAVLQVVGLIFVPESPVWMEGRSNHARVLPKKEGVGWRNFFKPPLRTSFFLGIAISLFQQFTGIGGVLYYAPSIFSGAFDRVSSDAFLASIGIGIINVGATLLSFSLIDKLGRRTLLLVGLMGIVLSLLFVSICQFFFSSSHLFLTLFGLSFFVSFYALSIGPVTWVILAEIFPQKIREIGVTLATGINWLSSYMVALTFPLIMRAWGSSATFFFYGIMSFLAYVFVLLRVPETKGKTLEQIEAIIQNQSI